MHRVRSTGGLRIEIGVAGIGGGGQGPPENSREERPPNSKGEGSPSSKEARTPGGGRGEKQEVVTGGGKGRIGFRRPGMELDVEVK